LVYQINSINFLSILSISNFSKFSNFQNFTFSPMLLPSLPPPLIVSPYYAMLRGWDLPIQANISVSFNTKLIPFNLVIAAVPVPAQSDPQDRPAPPARPTCASSRPACPLPSPLPAAHHHRSTAASTRKSKISFLLG
jgi:hypothetical protein